MTHTPHHTKYTAPVAGLPAEPSTPDIELHAARILAAMQRFEDLDWTSVRTIRSSRVRSAWATTDAVRKALGHLMACGLVEQGSEVDARGATRPRYRLTRMGETFTVHPTRLAQTIRKRVHVAFDEALAAAEAACPPGYILCMIPVDTAKILSLSRIPVPTEPPMF